MVDSVVIKSGGVFGGASSEMIDLSDANPQWTILPDMHVSRHDHDLGACPNLS